MDFKIWIGILIIMFSIEFKNGLGFFDTKLIGFGVGVVMVMWVMIWVWLWAYGYGDACGSKMVVGVALSLWVGGCGVAVLLWVQIWWW